ncbi:MAG: PepSY-associated TM helix domain-containing protein [Methylobacter tundripaludum]|nr:PepSY-associated TM helix domain-containing protein [Methylobacter tundripaludum]
MKVQDPSTRSIAGQTFVEWQWPLHSDRAFGWTGRILVFLTGLIRWLQKRKTNKLKNKDG